jgi:hypothetical protein
MIELLVMSLLPLGLAMRPEFRDDEFEFRLDQSEIRLDDDSFRDTSPQESPEIEVSLQQSFSWIYGNSALSS